MSIKAKIKYLIMKVGFLNYDTLTCTNQIFLSVIQVVSLKDYFSLVLVILTL